MMDVHDPMDVDAGDGAQEDIRPAGCHPIQVVIAPPRNPEDYEIIPRSNTVDKILECIEDNYGMFCQVQLTSGHVDRVAYDDLLLLENGSAALDNFQTRRLSVDQMAPNRAYDDDQYRPEDDLESGHQRKKLRFSESSELSDTAPRRSIRRAAQQATRQISTGYELGDVDKITTKSRLRSRNQGDSEDELAQDDGDYALPNIRSDINGATRTSSRKRKKPKKPFFSVSYADADSDIEFEPTRRSQRSTKASKSMREVDIDVEPELVEKATTAPKHVAIKEVFEELPKDDEFAKWHSQVCSTCGFDVDDSKGPLIFCQGCSYSYHHICLGVRSQRDHRVTKVSPNTFVLQCKFCLGKHRQNDLEAPNHSMCQTCRTPGVSCAQFSTKKSAQEEETIRLDNGGEDPITSVEPHLLNNAENVLFRCSSCYRAYHFEHLPPVTIDPDGIDIREKRLEDYSMDGANWNCKECVEAKESIHGLVAWRPINEDISKAGKSYDKSEDNIEYLVKWHNHSHFHDTWMPGAWVYGVAPAATRRAFHRRDENQLPKMDAESAIEPEWLQADVILDVRYRKTFTAKSMAHDLDGISDVTKVYVKFRGLGYDEVVWDQPPPRNSGAPWVAFCDSYHDYVDGKYFPSSNDKEMRDRINQYRALDFKKHCELKSQPSGLKSGRTLMEYQLEGVNWLLLNFHQQQNVILADEMGLGKTIQIVSLISSLVENQPQCWPFLVVVPNATCPNWRRELKDWAPGLRVVAYHGGKVSQDLAYTWELFPRGIKDGIKAHVVIMSFEAAAAVKSEFRSVKWAGLVVDEGQRLKSEDTQLYQRLKDLNIPFRVLLTGTPLQNNKRELFNLLQFIDPVNKAEELDAKYQELTKENLPELHNLLRPYFLRRTKLEVLKFLPPMSQIILPVTMTVLQEKLCKSIVARNPELIKAILSNGKVKASDRKNLVNIMADLRQCLCHPFCFNDSIEDRQVGQAQIERNLIEASPKLILLETMLPKLKERGHRVLIFSQFLRCLDILEDFLNIIGLQHGRIDGQMSALKKQKQIDAFNANNSPLFAMLLSTRAGGVGINLASADTVIIYDPDWNPHQDIQAISRAHRIGQKEKVLCFQLTTKDTVEENILQAGKRKLALDQALIERLDADSEANDDIESVLKRGAEALFSDREKAKIIYDESSVDKLLDRSHVEAAESKNGATDTQFRVWSNDSGTITDGMADGDNNASATDASVWEAIIRAREEQHRKELAKTKVEYGRGARRRGKDIDYSTSRMSFIEGVNDADSSDEEMAETRKQHRETDSSADDDYNGDGNVDDIDDDMDLDIDAEEQAHIKAAGRSRPLEPTKQSSTNNIQRPQKAPQSLVSNPDTTHRVSQPILPPPRTQTIRPPNLFVELTNPPRVYYPHNMQPNPVDPLRRHQQNTVAGNRAPTLPLPVPVPVPSQRTPKGAQPTMPTSGGQQSGASSNARTSPTNQDGVCLICKKRQPPSHNCVNFGSEISLRIAIDSLRTSPNQPNVDAYRDLLIRQLRQLKGR
ncbi:PHD/FYVE-zinc-finger like domain-containing protein [Hypoxylon sp. FL1150]|nr:PHD/FYVE-zinc-finger like domain-containing protein [Hypoxylon sp. FL1150]